LPGDVVCLLFNVEGLQIKDDGRVSYSMGLEVSKKGQEKPVLKREPQDMEATNSLGKGTFPSLAIWPIPRDSDAPGEYTLKLSIKDRLSGKAAKPAILTKKFEVVPSKLGFVQVHLTTPQGDPTPPVGVAGQKIQMFYNLVGFDIDKKEKQASVSIQVRILDSDGKPTLAKPYKGDLKADARSAPGMMVMVPFPIELNRPGKFKIELKAACNVSGKKTEQTLDLNVLPPQ
jgi:hypothetical protein